MFRSTYPPRQTAGVLPYTVTPNGTVMLLLGREGDDWSGFSGGIDSSEDVREGAAREAYEESAGILGREIDIRNAISTSEQFTVEYSARLITHYFLMEVPPITILPRIFQGVISMIRDANCRDEERFTEKVQLAWVTLDQLIESLARNTITFYEPFIPTILAVRDVLQRIQSRSRTSSVITNTTSSSPTRRTSPPSSGMIRPALSLPTIRSFRPN